MSYLIDEHINMLTAEGKLSIKTIEDRERVLRRLHDDLPSGWVFACREQLVAWLAGPLEPDRAWSPATKRVYGAHVIAGYAWLEEYGHLPAGNPAVRLPRPRLPRKPIRIATDEQLAVALTAPEPLLTAILLANYQGLRRAEAAGCWREHVTAESTTIWRAKGGETQTVPTHPAVWEHVSDLPPGPLVTELGRQMTPERLGVIAARWFWDVELIEIRDGEVHAIGLHHFRRRFGTIIQRTNRNLRVTQECLRHKRITTTEPYLLVTDDERSGAVRSIPWKHRPGGSRPAPPADTD